MDLRTKIFEQVKKDLLLSDDDDVVAVFEAVSTALDTYADRTEAVEPTATVCIRKLREAASDLYSLGDTLEELVISYGY